MVSQTRIVAAAVVSLAGGAAAQTASCVLAASGNYPLVDLNTLHDTSTDYQLVSPSNDAYTYYFNVCGQTVFQDAMCTSDSTLCEVNNGVAMDVYGYKSAISLARNDNVIVLTQTGQSACPFNKNKPYTSRIYFTCASSTSISMRTEYYYQCLLEIDFASPMACGGNEVRYRCDEDNLACIQDDSGSFGSYADCAGECVPAPPPPPPPPTECTGDCSLYQCSSDFQCVASATGHFTSVEDCTTMCSPFSARYSCYSGRCVRNTRGTYTSVDECAAACSSSYSNEVKKTETGWSCNSGVCTEDAHGPFNTESECEKGCSADTAPDNVASE